MHNSLEWTAVLLSEEGRIDVLTEFQWSEQSDVQCGARRVRPDRMCTVITVHMRIQHALPATEADTTELYS